MRNTYEAYILVKLRDGRQFVCALNRKKQRKTDLNKSVVHPDDAWELEVIWN